MPKAECAFIFITARMVNRFLYVSECLQPDADFARAAPKPEQNGRPMGQEGGHSHTKRLSTSVARGTDRHQEKALTPQTESCHIYICIYVYMYICIYVYMYICIYVYMYMYMYMYMYIYIYMALCQMSLLTRLFIRPLNF